MAQPQNKGVFMKKSVLGVISFMALSSWAGKFEVIGEGTSSKIAEFTRVNIAIVSECHSSALSARKVVDDLAQKAVVALEKYKSNIPAQLGVSPEANEQKVKTAYIEHQTVTICDEDHAWTSSTVIQFKLNNLQQLAQLQDELLALNEKSVPANARNVERLSLSLSKPVPGVLADTWDSMSDLALQRAHQNALRQVKVLTMGMANPKIELSKVETTVNHSGQALYDRVDSEGDTSGISLGSVSLKLSRKFTFRVEGQ
jgi:hypothetical protein